MNKLRPNERMGQYRTASGRCSFYFFFVQMPDDEIRIHVVWQPGSKVVEETKKLSIWMSASDSQEKDYGGTAPFPRLQNDPPPRSFDDALRLAIEWAEAAEAYISNSGEFDES